MKKMERTDGNLFNRYQNIISKRLKKHPEERAALQHEFSQYAWRLLGRGMKNPVMVSSHQIEMILEALRLDNPSMYKDVCKRAMFKFRDAKASEHDVTIINMPLDLVFHVIRGLEEAVETGEAREFANYLVDFFGIDRLAVGLPTYFFDHANKDERTDDDSVYDGGYELQVQA